MKTLVSVFLFIIIYLSSLYSTEVISVDLPNKDEVKLKPFAKIQFKEINESSGIVKSRIFDDLYWTLNDSGDEARIFAIRQDGSLHVPEWAEEYHGLSIPDAVNIDWEDISTDNNGNLYIGACGNNGNARKDLSIYIVKEPNVYNVLATRFFEKIDFYFPEQKKFPPKMRNYDCEAIFTANDKIYVLTKHRSDKNTCLYRFDSMDTDKKNALTKLSEITIGGRVTAADCSKDGKKLVVLTYNNVWLFEVDKGDDFFNGKKHWLPISAKQCEAISIEDNELIITNEQMDIFKLSVDDLIKVQ